MGRAVGPDDLAVVLAESREIRVRERAAGRAQVLVDVLELEERDHRRGHVGVREHPLERGLAVGRRILLEVRQVLVLRPLECLHRDDAHVLLAARARSINPGMLGHAPW